MANKQGAALSTLRRNVRYSVGARGAKIALMSSFLFLGGCWGEDHAEVVKDLMLSGNSELSAENITLDECELKISANGASPTKGSFEEVLRVDLSSFDLQSVRIQPTEQGKAILTMEGLQANDRLVAQALNVTKLLPAEFSSQEAQITMTDGQSLVQENSLEVKPGEEFSRETVERMMAPPFGNLVFRVSSASLNGEAIQPHEDAPGFYDFAKLAEKLPAPQTVSVSLHFNNTDRNRDSLLAGAVVIPSSFRLAAGSEEEAKELAKALFMYRESDCDA